MKRISILILLIISIAEFAIADKPEKKDKSDREQWFKEMREIKHNFLIKELDLTSQQQKEFFPVYDAMESEFQKIHRETRKLQRDIKKKKADEVTDLEYEKAAEALFEIKSRESQIEIKYFQQLKSVLKPRQLFLLKGAEDKFMRHLMKQRQKHSKKDKNNN